MKQRTMILRVWRDAAGNLHVRVQDPIRELDARLAAADALWETLQGWVKPLPGELDDNTEGEPRTLSNYESGEIGASG